MSTRSVPFLDLGRLHQSIWGELKDTIERVVVNSAFIGGRHVAEFEKAFAMAHGAAKAVGTNSGTDALSLGLRALGIGEKDEVIVPSMTFIATAEAVRHVGATPVIVDVDPETLLICPDAVAEARGPKTRAIIPVHLYGNVVPFHYIHAWKTSGLIVLEDCAQAHLATHDGRPVGTAGHAGAFSFFPGKNLGAFGDAGALVSNNASLAHRVSILRDHGRTTKYFHDEVGYSSRMDALQAAILTTKLRYLDTWTIARRHNAAQYRQRLRGLHDIRWVPWTSGSVHHLLVAKVSSGTRDHLREQLSRQGVSSGIHYPVPLSKQPSMEDLARPCPISEEASNMVISLPMDPLMSHTEITYVCEALERELK